MMEESQDSPWWTEEEHKKAFEQLHFLKQPTIVDKQGTNVYRDLNWMDFRLEVLYKYRNNELCEIGHDHISFLRQQDKKTPASTANFIIKNDVLMMYAKEFINIPPKEQDHWLDYQIQSEQEGLQ